MRAGVRSSVGDVARRLGTLACDRPRFAWPLFLPGQAERRWVGFHNRRERLVANPDGAGYDCDWQWTSDLTLAKVFPSLGRKLFATALFEWPVDLGPSTKAAATDLPDVSFVIGYRGEERLPHLSATLASLLGQTGCATEIIVVEQADETVLEGRLPSGVRWIYQKPATPGTPYSRSWAFNRGVREARGNYVILHDNDVLAPSRYAAEVVRLGREGFEAMRLQRFVFYLDTESTARLLEGEAGAPKTFSSLGLQCVRQNCEGHTIAVTREAYFRIGGHDESFVGWGGEDNEFFDRCRLLRFHPWGYLPLVHLWHTAQPEKARPLRAQERLRAALREGREQRATRLADAMRQTARGGHSARGRGAQPQMQDSKSGDGV